MSGRRPVGSAPDGARRGVVTMVDFLGTSGGAEKLALALSLRLDPERFERTLVVTRWADHDADAPPERAILAELQESGVRFIGLPRGRHRAHSARLAAWRPLLALLRSGAVDVLHSHKFGSNVWGALLGRSSGVPVIVSHEHSWSYQGQWMRRAIDREVIARFSDAFIAVSRADRRRMIELEGIPADRIEVIPNGIAVPAPREPRPMRAELGIPPHAPLVASVGVLRPEKGMDVVVRAAQRLVAEFPDLRVLIAGDGSQRDALARQIAQAGLENVVRLLGHRNDVPEILETVDVAVSASEREGSPLAVLEYMEAARPIVATGVGGVPELIEDGTHGVLVPPHDPAALAAGVAKLLRDPESARELGARARERRRREFDFQVTVERVEELYERLLDAKRSA
jgi:glycosyltransferase involved in cell wall biosynthesis